MALYQQRKGNIVEIANVTACSLKESSARLRPALRIKLPRTCTGHELLEAFTKASSFLLTQDIKWVAQPIKDGGREGVCATPAFRSTHGRLSRWLFGRAAETWETRPEADDAGKIRYKYQIVLEPVEPEQSYDAALVTFYFVLAENKWGEPTLALTQLDHLQRDGMDDFREYVQCVSDNLRIRLEDASN